MTSEKPSVLTTPIAILIGSAIISGALFLGLRTGTSDAASMHSPAASVMNQPPPAAVPTWKKAPAVDKAKVTKDAVAALDEHRKSLAEKCVAPALAKKPDPPIVKYLFNITFDAAGRPVARGVIEDRATSRPDVLACISDNFPVIHVPPPGQTVLIDVPLELP